MLNLFLGVLGISIWIFIYQLVKALFHKERYLDRISIYTNQEDLAQESKPKKQDTYRHGLGLLAKSIERVGLFSKYKEDIRKKLMKANILMKPEEYLALCVILFMVCGAIGLVFFGQSLLVVVLSLLGWFMPSFFVKKNMQKRLKTINNQLVDTMAILSNSMKAGHSFFQAVDSVSREMTGPIAEEFSKLQKEISLGVNTETALENMVNRVGSDDLELMVTAVLIQRQIGGNLAEILDNISHTVRQRVRSKGEIKVLTAQGRMSGWIISLLPIFLAIIISVISPQQMVTLITDPLGKVMLVLAVLMEAIGIIFVRKVINIEV